MTDLVVKVDYSKLTLRILEQSEYFYDMCEIRDSETGWAVDSISFPEVDNDIKCFYLRGMDDIDDDKCAIAPSIGILKQIIKTLDNLNKQGYKVVINCRTEL